MVNVNVTYTNSNAAIRFVDSCEKDFKRKINKTCDAIMMDPNTKIITLCGPTCSGKTTTADMIIEAFKKLGKKGIVLSIDNFYYDKEQMVEKNITNFESVEAIDIDLFSDSVYKLVNGIETVLPKFDFKERRRKSSEVYIPDVNDVYIIEGIQAMYPEVLTILKEYNVKSIFINVDKDLNVCGEIFTKEEIRLMRRIVRDYFHRNSSAQRTIELWKNVRENEIHNIIPLINKADFLIDSLLPYEVFVISKYFIDITENYSPANEGFDVINSLRERLFPLTNSCVTSAMIPSDSVFREFIV